MQENLAQRLNRPLARPLFSSRAVRFVLLLLVICSQPTFAYDVGDKAKSFVLTTARGQKIDLAQYAKTKSKRNLLLVFFRTGTCGICKHQLQEIGDHIEQVFALNTAVLGLSLDDAIIQQRVAEELGGRFPLVLDPDAKVVKAFNVMHPQEKLSRPSLFLLGPNMEVLYRYVGQGIQDRPPFATLMDVLKHYSGLVPMRGKAGS